tara:strand:+ start:7761 stop:8282 length:522 start_codon:yes stop_codon:yes gene_type:complete
MHNFRQKIIPNSSIKLEIEILSIIENIDLNRFLKTYKISNLWNGKFFIKRIIKKIFKYQLSSNIKWNNNFWDLITVSLVSIDIKVNTNNLITQLENYANKKRYDDIKKYKKLLLKKDMGNPLYITGKALNLIGAKIKNDDIYILDGSRRLVANILNHSKPNILLIDTKENSIG